MTLILIAQADWNPVTEAQAFEDATNGYRASKTFAVGTSKISTDGFASINVRTGKSRLGLCRKGETQFHTCICKSIFATPGFQCISIHILSVSFLSFFTTSNVLQCNPPLVLGPIVHYLNSLDALNTSNQRIRNLVTGAAKEECPPTGTFFFVDVRDVALSHVLAAEKQEAAGKRFFIVADKFSNKQIAEIIAEKFPQLKDGLPTGDALKSGDFPAAGTPGFDNRRSVEVLGLTYRSLEESVVDTVKSLLAVEGS